MAFEPYALMGSPASLAPYESLEEFCLDMPRFAARPGKAAVVGMNNGIATLEGRRWVEQTLANLATASPVKVAVIIRDPVEAYLSHVDGHRKWWGSPDKQPIPKELIGTCQFFGEFLN